MRVVSRLFFLTRALGIGRNGRALEYNYHLPQLVKRGDTAIDIGANLGYYTCPIADIVGSEGEVYAVEPVPVIFSVLKRNVGQRLGCGRRILRHGAKLCERWRTLGRSDTLYGADGAW